MKPTNAKVLVRVDLAQKDTMVLGGIQVSMALKYELNYREKSPVIAQVVHANDRLDEGDYLLCHHNHFQGKSPYHLQDDLYAIPANHTIFAILGTAGTLSPVYGNILAAKVDVETPLPVPAQFQTSHKDRGLVLDGGWTEFQPGDLVFTRPSAIYEIVYIWAGEERRICKIHSEMICAVVEKK